MSVLDYFRYRIYQEVDGMEYIHSLQRSLILCITLFIKSSTPVGELGGEVTGFIQYPIKRYFNSLLETKLSCSYLVKIG